MFTIHYQCPDCGGPLAYRSRRRNFFEKYLLPLALLQPVRCANCFRRNLVLVFAEVRDRTPTPEVRSTAA